MSVMSRLLDLYRSGGATGVAQGIRRFLSWNLREAFRRPVGYLHALGGSRTTYFGVELDLSSDLITTAERSKFVYKTYEREEANLIASHLPSDIDVVEIGGSIGFISCFTNQRLDSDQRHIVLEANPELISTLTTNRELNDCDFDIRNEAYAADGESVEFFLHEKFVGGSAHRETSDSVNVSAVNLETLAAVEGLDDFALIVDIEGGEFEMLDAELEFICSHCPVLIMEFHRFTNNDIDSYVRQLVNRGFELVAQETNVFVFVRP